MQVVCALLALLALAMAVLADITVEDGVLVLGDDNFEEAVAAHQNILVEFYAPWCGHCKALAPEYAKAAKALENSPVKLAKVDATVHNELAKAFEIRGFPTLKFFRNGKPSDYNGGRTEREIVTWLSKKTGPAAAPLSSAADLQQQQEQHEVFTVGVFSSLDSAAAKAFVAAAEQDETHVYAISASAEVRSQLAVDGDAAVVLKAFDDLRADLALSDASSADEISSFVLGNSAPLVQEFSPESSKKIFGSKVTNHVLFFTDKEASHHASTVAAYREAAKAFKGKALFVNVPTSEKKVLEYFDISAEDTPAMVLADLAAPSGIKKYKFSGEHSANEVQQFVQRYFNKELTPFLKSEDPQPEDTQGDVVVLRGTTFKDIVLNNDKDVLVEFYAPWCGHCAKLAPIWDELGKTVKASSDKVVIAKMDATANEVDVEGVAVQGFPTIYFFKGSDKQKPVKYGGGRTLEDFLGFLEENAHHGFSKDEL